MCELLIQVTARTGDDLYKTCALPQAGDVIAIMEDGHGWGAQELANPDWRIFALPGVDAAVFGNMLSAELPTKAVVDEKDRPRTLQYRGNRFDLAKLTGVAVQAALKTRSVAVIKLPVGTIRPLLQASVTKREPVADPAVSGADAAVIG